MPGNRIDRFLGLITSWPLVLLIVLLVLVALGSV